LDANGICIIKEFMNNIKNNYFINCITDTFEINLDVLCANKYGNFGIQEAIKIFGYYQCFRIIKNLINNILFYASKKYSSNVICFLFNYLKNNNFCKLLKVIKIIFNDKYICINNNYNNKIKNNFTIYQKLISNQYSIYIIFTIIQIILDIDEEFFNEKIINNQNINKINNVNHNNKKKSISSGESMEEDEEKNNESNDDNDNNDDDGKNEKIADINSINNIIYTGNDISFEEFKKIKKEVLLYIDNNTQNKEKKKLINLMKLNKIENTFITLKKGKNKK
jgi:hypothetical protein